MPKGPQGQKRSADVIGNDVHITQIVAREFEETTLQQPARRNSGLAGMKARVDNTTKEQRQETARIAVAARCG